jgi:mercuric ion transport protein
VVNDRTRVIGTAGGALGLGGIAAALGLCCTVPWAVALLGVTGAVAFARLAFLVPYALIGAAMLLGLSFWSAYRRPAVCSDASCAYTSRRTLRWIVWMTAALVALLSVVALTSSVAAF